MIDGVRKCAEQQRVVDDLYADVCRICGDEGPVKPLLVIDIEEPTKLYPPQPSEFLDMKFPFKRYFILLACMFVVGIPLSASLNGGVGVIHAIFGFLCFALSVAWLGIGVGLPLMYHKRKKAAIEDIVNSDEYRQKCAEVDTQNKQNRAEYDAAVAKEQSVFNEETIPAWQREYDAWEREHNGQLEAASDEYDEAMAELQALYDAANIPAPYRNSEAIVGIYTNMSSGNVDLHRAIDLYIQQQAGRDRQTIMNKQDATTEAVHDMNDEMRAGFDATVDTIIEQGERIRSTTRRVAAASTAANQYLNERRAEKYLKERKSH